MSNHAGQPDTDRNLLYGILAVQRDFVSREVLIGAMNAWLLAKHRSLGDILAEQAALSPERRALLDAMVNEHIKAHGNDVQRSLAAAGFNPGVRSGLETITDAELTRILAAHNEAPTAERRTPDSSGMRFKVLRSHAQGGLGVVSVARDIELGREVALKEMQAQYADDPDNCGRFVREAEVTGALEHPGIVPVYAMGQYPDGRPYYAMRFIRGETLQEAIRRFHAGDTLYTLRGLLTRLVAVCNAVAYAHSRGVIHRDLKPGNVMLGPFGETLVVDWGLAKVLDRSTDVDGGSGAEERIRVSDVDGLATRAGALLGTPAYMSPEQARGEVDTLGPATDVYSLGATLYTLLTGRAPVVSDKPLGLLKKVAVGDWPAPRQVNPQLPRPLDAICRKAMAAKAGDRYGSALELAGEIERWLADERVNAYREPWRTRMFRWVRRHRTKASVAAASALVALLMGGAGLVWWQQEQARRRTAAEAALMRVSDLEARERWSDARTTLDEAEERLGTAGSADLRRRLEQAKTDVELASRLEDLRLQRADRSKEDQFEVASTDTGYEKLFHEAGIGVPGDDEQEVAGRVTQSAISEVLVAALDDWAAVAPPSRREWVLRVARRADSHPWRDRLRDPAVWNDGIALAQLVRQAPVEQVTAGLASAVADRLQALEKPGEGEKLLRAIQVGRPSDFWLNYHLAIVTAPVVRANDSAIRTDGEQLAFARAALAARPDNVATHIRLATSLYSFRKYEDADALLSRALELDPRSGRACTMRGVILEAQGKKAEAETLLLRGVELEPTSSMCLYRLANFREHQRKPKEAEALYRASIELNPNAANSLYNLGLILAGQGKNDEAEVCFRKVIQTTPKHMAVNALRNLLAKCGRAREMAAVFREAAERDPGDADSLFGLGRELERAGKPDEAVAAYQKAIAVNPDHATAHCCLGAIRLAQDKSAEAEAHFRRSIEINPRYATAHNNLGVVQRDANKLKEAAASFRTASEIEPGYAMPVRNLGTVFERQGELIEAVACFRKAAELAPGFIDAEEDLARVLLAVGQYRSAREAADRLLAHLSPENSRRPDAEALIYKARLGERLLQVLTGADHPANPVEALALSDLCYRHRWYDQAVRLASAAFNDDPKLAADLKHFYRYNAACSAALAGCGKGESIPKLAAEQARLRRQALEWLKADLAVYSKQLMSGSVAKPETVTSLNNWLEDDDFAEVRDATGLAKLPESEQKDWEAFWSEVKILLGRTAAAH
jgi:tetratricopeptide (TPR) repeat protein